MSELILELVEGEGAGQTYDLDNDVTAGRDPAQQIALSDDQVSRRHARFSVSGGAATVEDLGSRNGTYVNGQVLHGSRGIVPGDRVRMGLTVFELRSRAQVDRQASAVSPMPQITMIGADVLRPAPEADLAPVAEHPADTPAVAQTPDLRAEEHEPAFIPDAIRGDRAAAAEQGGREGYDSLAALVDSRVKRQTNVAAFALLAIAALAVIIYLGIS
ncbi:MAG: FHA domain-containing protein [Solirubrobacterales bacterium]